MNTTTASSYQNLVLEDGYTLQPSPERSRIMAPVGQYSGLPIPSPTKTFQDSPMGLLHPYEEAFHADQTDRLLQYEQSSKSLPVHNYFKVSPIRGFRQNCALQVEWEKSALEVDTLETADAPRGGLLGEQIQNANCNLVTDENKGGHLNFNFDQKSLSRTFYGDNEKSKDVSKDGIPYKNNFKLTTLKGIDNICSISSIEGTINKLHMTSPTVSSSSEISNSISDLSREESDILDLSHEEDYHTISNGGGMINHFHETSSDLDDDDDAFSTLVPLSQSTSPEPDRVEQILSMPAAGLVPAAAAMFPNNFSSAQLMSPERNLSLFSNFTPPTNEKISYRSNPFSSLNSLSPSPYIEEFTKKNPLPILEPSPISEFSLQSKPGRGRGKAKLKNETVTGAPKKIKTKGVKGTNHELNSEISLSNGSSLQQSSSLVPPIGKPVDMGSSEKGGLQQTSSIDLSKNIYPSNGNFELNGMIPPPYFNMNFALFPQTASGAAANKNNKNLCQSNENAKEKQFSQLSMLNFMMNPKSSDLMMSKKAFTKDNKGGKKRKNTTADKTSGKPTKAAKTATKSKTANENKNKTTVSPTSAAKQQLLQQTMHAYLQNNFTRPPQQFNSQMKSESSKKQNESQTSAPSKSSVMPLSMDTLPFMPPFPFPWQTMRNDNGVQPLRSSTVQPSFFMPPATTPLNSENKSNKLGNQATNLSFTKKGISTIFPQGLQSKGSHDAHTLGQMAIEVQRIAAIQARAMGLSEHQVPIDFPQNPTPVPLGKEKNGRWKRCEHERFLHGLKKYGKEWKKIAGCVGTRSVVQTRTHAQKFFQKLKKIINTGISFEEALEMNLDGEDDDDVTITTITTESEINGNVAPKTLKLKVPSSSCSISSQGTPLTGCSSAASMAFPLLSASPSKSKVVSKSKANKLVRTSSLSSTISAYNSADDMSVVDTSRMQQVKEKSKAKVKEQKSAENNSEKLPNTNKEDKNMESLMPITEMLLSKEQPRADEAAQDVSANYAITQENKNDRYKDTSGKVAKCVSFTFGNDHEGPSTTVPDSAMMSKTNLNMIQRDNNDMKATSESLANETF